MYAQAQAAQGGGKVVVNNQRNHQGIDDDSVAVGVYTVVRATLDEIEGVDDEIKTIDFPAADALCRALLSKPNDAGQVRTNRAVLLTLMNYFAAQQEPAVERLIKSTEEDNPSMERAKELARTIIYWNLHADPPANDPEEVTIESLNQRIVNLEDELSGAFKDIEELEDDLQAKYEEVKELEDILQAKEDDVKKLAHDLAEVEGLPCSRRTKRRNRDPTITLNEVECVSTSSASTSLAPSSLLHASSFDSLNEYISEIKKTNGKFLQLMSNNTNDTYTFGNCSACTVILNAISHTSDLSRLERLMQMFAIIWDTDMTLTREAKEKIVCIDMKGPVSIALKALYKSVAQNNVREERSHHLDEALAAYNKYNDTSETVLPTIAYKTTGKVNNNIMIAMFVLIGIRVSKKISLHQIMQIGNLTDPIKDAKRKEDIAVLVGFIAEMTGVRPNESVTIAWMYTNVLVPACDNPSHEVRLRVIKCINFLIEEMQHSRYFEAYKSAEVIAMTKLADNVDSFELSELREKHKASLYICERKDGGEGGIVASWRRLTVPKVLFSSLCSRAFAKRAVEFGLLQEMEIDLFTFGVLNESASNFYLRDFAGFLFDVESYSIENGKMASIAEDIKKVFVTATKAMKQFQQETHFAEPKFQQYYEEFFKSMSSIEETDNII